jgi:bile acid:Na+ symporter, BASS family
MNTLDDVRINFSQDQMWLLNICLGFLMFSIALELDKNSFKITKDNIRGATIGAISQMLLMPLLTIVLIWVLSPAPSVALGMALVGACPGGNVSNYAVHLARANTSLSVMLTSISTLCAAITTPAVFSLIMLASPQDIQSAVSFSLDPMQLIGSLVQLLVLPLILGMSFAYYKPQLAPKLIPYCKKISLLIFIAFVVGGVMGNLDVLKNHLHHVVWIVIIHNCLALIVGYYFPKLMGLSTYDARAVSIETGIQNSGLALILVFKYFNGLGGMALIAAWWSIWHLISAFCLAMWWQREGVNTKQLA